MDSIEEGTPPAESYYHSILATIPGYHIIESRSRFTPSNEAIDSRATLFDESVREHVISALKQITWFSQFPLVTDSYTDHVDRRDWRRDRTAEVEAKYGKKAADHFFVLAGQNRLKRNVLTPMAQAADLVGIFVPLTDEQENLKKELTEILEQKVYTRFIDPNDPKKGEIDPWDKTPLEEKVRIAEDITDLATRFTSSVLGLDEPRERYEQIKKHSEI